MLTCATTPRNHCSLARYVSSLIFGSGPNIGIKAGLAVDASRIRGGPDWDVSNLKEMCVDKGGKPHTQACV